MFKKTIFVTLFTVLTAGTANQAQAQSAQEVGQWLGAAIGGALGYNNGGRSDRGAKTAGGAILGALAGNFIGKGIDQDNARQMGYQIGGCIETGRSNCRWSNNGYSTDVQFVRREIRRSLDCRIYNIAVQTPMGPTMRQQCICFEDDRWITVEDEYSDFDRRQREKDELEQRILNRERIIKERRNRSESGSSDRRGSCRGSHNDCQGGVYGRDSGRISDAELDAISRRNDRILGNGASSSTTVTRITETNRTSDNSGADSLLRLSNGNMCPVTEAFKDAQFGYMDDVCRQNIGANSREEALALCRIKSTNPDTCVSK